MTKSSKLDVPDIYSDINKTLEISDNILSEAVDDAQTLFHTMVVASLDGENINSRVMVLREFNLQNKLMRFHTDYRSSKIQQLTACSSASVIGYDPALKVQIKLKGNIKVHFDDEITKSAWQNSTNRSKKCYSIKGGSTKLIKDPEKYDIQDFEPEDGYDNFSVLIFTFTSLEFLYLKSSGHRRAIHKWDDELESNWLVP